MRRLILVLLAVAAVAGCRRPLAPPSPPSPAVNPAAAQVYATVVHQHLRSRDPNPDRAIALLKKRQKESPGNGMDDFLMAAAYARQSQWGKATAAVAAGNRAPSCLHYVADGPFALTPAYSTLRELARGAAAAAPRLGPAKGGTLLQQVRGMAKRVAASEPQGLIPVLVSTSLRKTADEGLVRLYRQANRSADLARARRIESADTQWANQVRADFQPAIAQTDLSVLIRKHFTEAEWKAYDNGRNVTPEVQRKLAAMKQEIDRIERPLTQKAIQTMPE